MKYLLCKGRTLGKLDASTTMVKVITKADLKAETNSLKGASVKFFQQTYLK